MCIPNTHYFFSKQLVNTIITSLASKKQFNQRRKSQGLRIMFLKKWRVLNNDSL